MANLEKIKDVRDIRNHDSQTVEQLHLYSKGLVEYGCTWQEIEALIGEYEDIIEYLVERLVHSESERFSK